MRTSRKLHKIDTGKDRLHDALRELYREGVRVHAGEPAPEDKITNIEINHAQIDAQNDALLPSLVDWDIDAGIDSYDHKLEA